MSGSAFGVLIAGGAALSWGLVYASSQRLVSPNRLSPVALLVSTAIAGSIILLPAFLYYRADMLRLEPEPGKFVWFVCTVCIAEVLVFYSVQLLGGTEAGLIQVSYPLWTALDLYLSHGEVPSRLTMLGGALILSGVAYISWFGGPPKEEPEDGGEKTKANQDTKTRTAYQAV